MSTAKDIAEKLHLSQTTVSVVLRGKGNERKIAEKTQRLILEAAKEMGYYPNLSARRLRASEQDYLRIVVYYTTDYRAVYMLRFLKGLQMKIHEKDMKVELIIKQYEKLEDSFDTDPLYHAAIVCNASREDICFLQSVNKTMPVVVYNRSVRGFSSVGVDNEKIGSMAADIFSSKGIKKCLLISNFSLYEGMEYMGKVFRRCAMEKNIQVDEIVTTDNMDAALIALNQYMKEHEIPEAVFSASSFVSYSVFNELMRQGYKIPENLRFLSVGSGIIEYEKYGYVSMSVLEIPREEMAGKCLEVAIQLIRNEIKTPVEYCMDPVYIERESC